MTIADLSETAAPLQVAPGEIVVVRDAEWLVIKTEQTTSGTLVRGIGLSELVRDTTAAFYSDIDEIQVLDPARARVVADTSSRFSDARLWLEATLRRQPVATADDRLTVSTRMLADPLDYQLAAVRKALDPSNLRPRLLIADAVGLGKTIEIGMILAELARRGQGERILVVTPKHVLEQMQRELWTRFALPFVRLDSVGLQRVRQLLPATRNPFSYFPRVIVSIDTLKQDQYRAHLERHRWDAVVIDESHNITGDGTLNNRLARTIAPNTNALILASATPHNGRRESFAELIRLLEPSAVRPDGDFDKDAVRRLVLRRHRHSPEVRAEVGTNWAERKQPRNVLVAATPAENAVADELANVWLYPNSGASPYSGDNKGLFPWTLAKAFLSSPAALQETVRNRLQRLTAATTPKAAEERRALQRLQDLTTDALASDSAKFEQLLNELRRIGVGHGSDERVVVFSERVATLRWLSDRLKAALKLGDEEVRVLHGGLSDVEQQEIVEHFKQASSRVRVLVTGDVASEGVNLHSQCHEMVHFDIPWSLIRIEQRNGRVDRYGQRTAPQITTLLLEFDDERFRGDTRVLTRLMEREHEAHLALGESASLMGEYSAKAEEDAILDVLRGSREFDDVVRAPEEVLDDIDSVEAMLAAMFAEHDATTATVRQAVPEIPPTGLFESDADFLRAGLNASYAVPNAPVGKGGVGFANEQDSQTLVLNPPVDLQRRLEVLPQSYLAERGVVERFRTTTSRDLATRSLSEAQNSRTSTSLWPTEHYLGPLHPMLDWVADKTLSKLGRNEVFAVRGRVAGPTVALIATLTDQQARTISAIHITQLVPNAEHDGMFASVHPTAAAMIASLGMTADAALVNPGPVDTTKLTPLIARAVHATRDFADAQVDSTSTAIEHRVNEWHERLSKWQHEAEVLIQRQELRERAHDVASEHELADSMRPRHVSVRPLLVVVPEDWPIAAPMKETNDGE